MSKNIAEIKHFRKSLGITEIYDTYDMYKR